MTEKGQIYSKTPQYLQHTTVPVHEAIQEEQKLT